MWKKHRDSRKIAFNYNKNHLYLLNISFLIVKTKKKKQKKYINIIAHVKVIHLNSLCFTVLLATIIYTYYG